MKKIIIIASVGIVVAAIVAATLWPKTETCTTQADSCHSQQSKAEIINQNIKNGAYLVDVREPSEFATGRATGAINIPLDSIQSGTYPTDEKDAIIYLYCRSGKRAATALSALEKAGYKNAQSLGSLADVQKLVH